MRVLNLLSQVLGITGAAVIVWGSGLIMVRFVKLEWLRMGGQRIGPRREALRHQLGSYLLLGLEILIAADILRTITHPTLQDMALLAGIVVIRTVISFFLDRELAASHLHELSAARDTKGAEPDKAPLA